MNVFDPDVLDLSVWTAIASRPRLERGKWRPVENAPLSLKQAQRLREAGRLVQALAYTDTTETVVVRRPRQS
jgi:hypothetical protein